jgi:peptidoglycan/LPS O-acetylase OafA/YrhL
LKRISGLDGVRALAITLVIGGHILPHHPNAWMRAIFAGQDGVGLFFVLSGFLVTALLLRERMETGGVDIAHFYFRRAFRIVPPLLFYLFAVMCIGWVEGDPIPLRVVSSVVFFYHNMTHEGTWMLEHTWSLAVEEQFYLLWPLLFVLLLRLSWRALIWTIVSLILLTPVFRIGGHLLHWEWMHHKESFLLVTRMDSLLSGCLVACLLGTRRFESMYKRLERLYWIAPVFLFIVSPMIVRRLWFRWDYPIGFTLNSIAGAYFILWLSRNEGSLLGRVANWKPVARVGVMSYSIYLWQTLPTHYSDGARGLLLSLVFILVAASLSFYCVERPAAAARSYLERVLFKSRTIHLRPDETISLRPAEAAEMG